MGLIGGTIGYKILKWISPIGDNGSMDGSAYIGKSKLATLLGQNIWNEIVDKVVIDFGCGEGSEVIEMARHGAHKVIGLDIQEKLLEVGRTQASKERLSEKCIFELHTNEKADVITAIDSFEHFGDPSSILVTMSRLLKPSGSVLIAFGPTWYHPLGGHLFSVFPWAHLIFTEEALIRWRSDFKADGAQVFRGVTGGLNQMTIARFEQIVESSPFRFSDFEIVPIRNLKVFSNRLTREFTTAIVRCKLVLR
jgi:SAM-dependent methyltransferase